MNGNLISVVDDDESVCRTTKLLVESFGYRAPVFESRESLEIRPTLRHVLSRCGRADAEQLLKNIRSALQRDKTNV